MLGSLPTKERERETERVRGEIHLIYFFNLRHFGDAQRGNNSTQLETDGAARGGNTGLGGAERGLGKAVVG